jgi:hypothetical protein
LLALEETALGELALPDNAIGDRREVLDDYHTISLPTSS